MRQDDHHPRADGAPAGERERRRPRLPERRGHAGQGRGDGQPAPLARHRDGVPGGDERVQPGQDDRLADRRADGAARHGVREGGPGAGARAARAGRDLRGRGPIAIRTSSPAACASERRSRSRSRAAAGPARRRADDRARRDGAGPDPRAPGAPHARPGPGDDPRHARPAGGGPGVRPRGRDVRRRDRRDGGRWRRSTTTRGTRTRACCSRPRPTCSATRTCVSIPGAPPRLDREIAGCPFTPRCDSAFSPCSDDASAPARGGAAGTRPCAT